MMDYSGNIVRDAAVRGPNLILNELHFFTTDLADLTHDCNFHQVLTTHVVVSSINSSLSGHVQLCKVAPIDFMTLAGRWMIVPDCAKETVQRTTQQGVRTCLNPTIVDDSRLMTGCFAISGSHIQLLQTLCLLARLPVVEISVLRCTPRPLAGQEPTP